MTIPYENTIDFTIEEEEFDNKVGHVFVIEENTGLSVQSSGFSSLVLKNQNNDFVISGFNGMLEVESIDAGTYYLEVYDDYGEGIPSGTLTFNIDNPKASDVELGLLAIPYEESIDFSISKEEIDDKVGYSFQISEETNVRVNSTSDVRLVLKDANGDHLYSGYDEVRIESLSSGTYYLEVSGYYYEDGDIAGVLTFNINNPKASDIDLGVLTIPYDNRHDFLISNTEFDDEIGYTFQIANSTGYSISTTGTVNTNLYDSEGNNVAITGNELRAGTYYLVLRNGIYNGDSSGTITIVLDDFTIADRDLGALVSSYNQSFNYTTIGEIDQKVRYDFSVGSQLNYVFEIVSGNYDSYLYLYDTSGSLIQSDDDGGIGGLSKMTGVLNAGSYYIEVGGYSSSTGIGTLSIDLQ